MTTKSTEFAAELASGLATDTSAAAITQSTVLPSQAAVMPSVRQWLFLFVFVILLPGMIGAAFMFRHLLMENNAQWRQSTLEMTRSLMRDVDDEFGQLNLLAVSLAQSHALADNDLIAFDQEARALLAAAHLSNHVVVSDVHGQQLLDTQTALGTPLPRYGNAVQLRQVIASGRAVISEVFDGTAINPHAVAVAVPVVSKGKAIYVLSVFMQPGQLDTLMQRHHFPVDWIVSIFDPSGTIAARTRQPARFVGQKASQAIQDFFLVQSEGLYQDFTQENIPVQVFFSTSAMSHWKGAISIPDRSLSAVWLQWMALLALLIVVLLAPGITLACYLGWRIAHSVTALVALGTDLAAGKTPAVPRVYSHEAGQIVKAIALSAVELRDRTLALKTLNRDLEARMQERTREAIDLYDRAPCGYHALDAAGIVIQVNQTELDLLGYEREAYLGQAIHQFMTEDSKAIWSYRTPQLLREGQMHDLDVDFLHKDGTVVPCLISANVELDAQGQFAFLRSTLVDNRIGKERQQRINSLNAFLNEVLESLPFGVAVLNEQQQVVLRNSLFGTLQGYPAELARKTPLTLAEMLRFSYEHGHYPQRLYDDVLADYLALIVTRQQVQIERRQPDGIYLKIVGRPIATAWTLLTYTDITAFRRAEQALSQARIEAETANLAKSAFLANMTHELRTPLNAVIGLARLMADSPLNAWQRDYVDKIQLSAQSVQALINDILDLSKMEANQLRIESIPFSLNLIMRTAASVLGVGVGHKDVAVVLDLSPEVPDALVGDPMRLQQILLNLISNALKFTERGEIVVSVRCQSIQPRSNGSPVTLQVTVRDTGIGIAAGELETIFNAFVQADKSTSRLYGGTGLGLAISHRLVMMMGGQISVESVPEQGSVFRFSLPLTAGVPVVPALPICVPTALRVVIVEGHGLTRSLLRDACLASGWQVRVIDPHEATLPMLVHASAAQGGIDLLLLDGQYPGLDAMALLRQVHTRSDRMRPRTLLMVPLLDLERFSADSSDGTIDEIVAKPLTRWSLAEAVARLFPPVPAPVAAAPLRRVLPLSGLRLLVAEDNAINQEVIAQVLVGAGADVVMVGDGIGVLAALTISATRFDIVLMDIQMPLIDGYTAARLIGDNPALATLPVIALTALAQGPMSASTKSTGMTGFLAKPLDVNALLTLLADAGITWPASIEPVAAAAPATIRLAGLDFVAALKIFGGDQLRLGSILCTFVERQGDDAVAGQRLFENNETDAAIDLVHQLRGVAASLHAGELFYLAGLTETALLDGPVEALPELFRQLQDAMTMIRHCARQMADYLARA
ncbi:hybrid sensor histidine kinase/response regulator [Actimicrobium sp. CCI2.3]|uniref:hybrid sensor histidine kinase/response regulator n=1 Tax=Actimicrobium sp. CCI2.3 TaxID=3048616 RepID=UPI002AB5C8C3|nr:ATP-binding protein [Actimicrobium sp. CCI2.3]MDY7573257.1 ATP-binding protein [Actimicrobium sp. CCI2.3]MEB0022891.1 ATP-binding protein [Actimicrobium sp. CCI2.3]